MGMLSEFKKFALRGNVVDLATGVIVGGAFGRIVSALVADVIMPVVALVMPSGAWREGGWVLHHAADPKDDVVLRWGSFLGSVLDFLVVALVLFFVVTRLLRAAEAALAADAPAPALASATRPCPECLEAVPVAARRCRACTSALT